MSEPRIEPVRKFVRAGAGAGKTYSLTRQVVSLALDFQAQTGTWPKTILTTFTRKATQELKERMLEYCIKEKPEALEFVQSTSYLKITTMHGLFSHFLSQHSYALGIPNMLKVVDSSQADFWRKQILREFIDQGEIPESLQVFDFKRLLANLNEYENVYWADGKGQALSLDDLEKIVGDLSSQLAVKLKKVVEVGPSQDPGDKWDLFFSELTQVVATLEASTTWDEKRKELEKVIVVLKKPRKSKNHPGLFPETDELLADSLKFLKKIAGEPEYDPKHWPKIIETLAAFKTFASQFMKKVVEKKKEEGALEANDLEFYSSFLVKNRPEVLDQFSKEVDAWFIDEFQDTSPLQLDILEAMIGDKSCYIVGDPQQSIYLFRGSRSEVFFGKNQSMEKEGAEIQWLQKNYRSQEKLLEFFNVFFPSLRESFTTMEPTKDPIKGSAVTISHVTSDEEGAELCHLTQQIGKLLDQGVNPKDICVLSRTHRHSDVLQKKFTQLGFPVLSHSSSNFYSRREVLDALALLKFLINPWDDENLILLLRSPWLGLKDSEIVKTRNGSEKNYWRLFKEYFTESNHPGGLKLMEALKKVEQEGVAWCFRQALLDLGFFAFTHQVDSSGRREANLWKLVNLVEKSAREPGTSLLQLVQQGALATQLEDIGDASSPTEPNKIQLMTVHASKGLQFDYVFLPFLHKKPRETTFSDFTYVPEKDLWSFRLPLENQNQFLGGPLETLFVKNMKSREQEESLRVLYVAMTRAKLGLFLSWSGKNEKKSWGGFIENSLDSIKQSDSFEFKTVDSADERVYKWKEESSKAPKPFMAAEDAAQSTPPLLEKASWKNILKSQEKRREGVVLHRIFESLKNHNLEVTKALGALWRPGKEAETSKAIDFVWQGTDIPMQDIIQNGFVEWGYQRQEGEELVEKRIDLWGVADDTLWVVDYKTGSTDFKDKAFEQMDEYLKTLVGYLDWKGQTKKVAVYPFAEKIFVD